MYLNPTRIKRWTFRRERRVEMVDVSGPTAYNTHQAMLEPLLAGSGICKIPGYFARQALQEGRLVRLLPEYQCDQLPIYLVHQDLARQPPRVRKLVASFAEWFAGDQGYQARRLLSPEAGLRSSF